MNLSEIYEKFPTQKECVEYLEKIRWKEQPICPYCKSIKNHASPLELRHFCHTCKTSFSVKVGTIFDDTRLPLQKWFLAITLILNAKKGISSRQLARDLGVTKDTAWSMQMRIRNAMTETPSLLLGVVEMDETYIGARKPRKTSKDKDDDGNYPKFPRGRGTSKTPVVGMVERGGKVKAMKHTELKFADLKKTAETHIDFENTVLMTDDYRGYIPFKHLLNHQSVNHSQKQWANGLIHTNTIESFWAILKRGITGQYHHLSDKYLNRYITEFCFKYNNRKTQDVFNLVLTNALGA
jgi:transposase-like protein